MTKCNTHVMQQKQINHHSSPIVWKHFEFSRVM